MKLDYSLIHLLLACALFPGYYNLGPQFKIALMPYVCYLVLTCNARFLPALAIHFIPGSTVSTLILVCCSLLPATRIKELHRKKLATLYLIAALPLPLIFYQTATLFKQTNLSWAEVLQSPTLYLGIFPFFYGALSSTTFDRKVFNQVLLVLTFAMFLQLLYPTNFTVRYVFLSVPVFLTFLFLLFIAPQLTIASRLFSLVIPLGTCGLIVTGAIPLTFAVLATTAVAIAFILARLWSSQTVSKFPLGKLLAISAILLTVYLVNDGLTSNQNVDSASITEARSFDDFFAALKYKAFGDRAPLWAGAWRGIAAGRNLWPPERPPSIFYETLSGVELEVDFGAHNIGLELLRNFGIVIGVLGILVYLAIIVHLSTTVFRRELPIQLLILGATVLASAFIGGIVGQYVLMCNFSFLLMGLAGIVCGFTENPGRLRGPLS
jgi:hypothetical protein